MLCTEATNQQEWDSFLAHQPWRPFLQSWTMGNVYRDTHQEPIRLCVHDDKGLRAICFGCIVSARRGKHISIPYGPIFDASLQPHEFDALLPILFQKLQSLAQTHQCAFIRCSPFLDLKDTKYLRDGLNKAGVPTIDSPLHLLAEHLWFIQLQSSTSSTNEDHMKKEEDLLQMMRKTTRNLIRRAEKEGVTIEASLNPMDDVEHFIRLHEETRKRHGFTPYTNSFFRAQVRYFAERNECTVYLAKYQGEVIAASIHMHSNGETSYHHGASSRAFAKIPASYLLQWRALQDGRMRKDRVYNFWGIAPPEDGKVEVSQHSKHPFAGVTLFKTGFGGELLNLGHCFDIPLSKKYWLTYAIECIRKWKRGF